MNSHGCRSTDSEFPIVYQGQPDPLNPRFSWILPESPFNTQCGYLDRDADGLLDWAETELAWVFRPYLIFDNDENYTGNDTFNSINGIHIIYQLHPLENSNDNITSSSDAVKLLRFRIVLLFRTDSNHAGDSEVFNMELISREAPFRKWEIHLAQWRRCMMKTAGCYWIGSWADYLIPDDVVDVSDACIEDPNRMYCDAPRCYRSIQGILDSQGKTQFGLPCNESLDFCQPTIHVSKGKHGLYVSHDSCQGCFHGFSITNPGAHEECGGGWSGPACFGLPGAMNQNQGVGAPGFLRPSSYFSIQDIHDSELINSTKKYLGNIGEVQFKDRTFISQQFNVHVITDVNNPENFVTLTWTCTGSELDIQTWTNSILSQLSQTVIDGSSSLADIFADPQFLFYPTAPPVEWPEAGCVPGTSSLSGILGSLETEKAITEVADVVQETQPVGIYGLYANFEREGILDYNHGNFCGGKRDEGNCEAKALRKIFKRLPQPFNSHQICVELGSSWLSDLDQDGAPDIVDCDPLHPHLKWDLDQDGACDEPPTSVDACMEVCQDLHQNPQLPVCIAQCQQQDNCSPLIGRAGAYSNPDYLQCQKLQLVFDEHVLDRCQRWFSNREQTDVNHNGIGDFCERGISQVDVDVRSSTFGMNQGFFAWCPDRDATFSALLTPDRETGPVGNDMLSVGLCACPGGTESTCRDFSNGERIFYCPSDPLQDKTGIIDFSNKDYVYDSNSQNFKYFYHPVKVQSNLDLGVLTSNTKLTSQLQETSIQVPDQGLVARWKDVAFQAARIFVNFRYDRFQHFPGFQTNTMLETFPTGSFVALHDRYSKLKFSSPQPAPDSKSPTNDDWNPRHTGVEYGILDIEPETFYYTEEEYGDLCVTFPRPIGFPVGFVEGSPLLVNPLWDPPRDLRESMYGWVLDENGSTRMFSVDSQALKVRSYVSLPAVPNLFQTEVKFFQVDSSLMGETSGNWRTVASTLHAGVLYYRNPEQEGPWTTVTSEISPKMEILAFHQASPQTLWVIGRDKIFSPPILSIVNLATGDKLNESPIPEWNFARVESMVSGKQGEAYFLVKQPAHLLPRLWKLDSGGIHADIALPALFPPGRGALAMDARMGKLYLVSRAQLDHKTSLWEYDLVTNTWTRLSGNVPMAILKEPRLLFSGGRLWFSDLKENSVWEWTQDRWISHGNPLLKAVGP
ncbi:hypothetical protein KKD52_06025 [Myxococcota bacterium]|nr:hypothetical protein [Myxococcota bacterium]